MPKAKNLLRFTTSALLFVFCLWVALSFIDVVSDNLSENPEQHALNLFSMIWGA